MAAQHKVYLDEDDRLCMPIDIPEKLLPLLKPKDIKVVFGGRGGGKSVSGQKLISARMSRVPTNVLAMREHMNSIEESIHATLSEQIYEMGLHGVLRVKSTSIDGDNGSKVRYAQLHRNPTSVQSRFKVDICLIEEGQQISEESLLKVIPTIREEGSEIWIFLNIDSEDGAVYKHMIRPHWEELERNRYYEDDEMMIIWINIDDNPFASEKLRRQCRRMRKENPKLAQHIWDGYPNMNYEAAIIQPEWVNAAYKAHEKLTHIKPQGARVSSFDPSDEGRDAKAYGHRHGSIVTDLRDWDGDKIDDAITRAFMYADDNRADQLIWDGHGLGAAVKVGLEKRLEGKQMTAHAFYGGAKSELTDEPYVAGDSDEDPRLISSMFKNNRALRYWRLRDRFIATYNAIEHGVYSDPDDLISLDIPIDILDRLRAELLRVERMPNDNVIQLIPKEKIVPSSNLSDALMMLFGNPAPRGPGRKLKFKGWA